MPRGKKKAATKLAKAPAATPVGQTRLPNTARKTDSRTESTTCFVIMPFTVKEADKDKYVSGHWDEVYEHLIKPAVKRAKLECDRDDEDPTSRMIVESIWKKIEEANLVVCDVSSANPNVMVEFGWALRSDKRYVLISDDRTANPFNLSQLNRLTYSADLRPRRLKEDIERLSEQIKKTHEDTANSYSIVTKLIDRDRTFASMTDEIDDEIYELMKRVASGDVPDIGERHFLLSKIGQNLLSAATSVKREPGTEVYANLMIYNEAEQRLEIAYTRGFYYKDCFQREFPIYPAGATDEQRVREGGSCGVAFHGQGEPIVIPNIYEDDRVYLDPGIPGARENMGSLINLPVPKHIDSASGERRRGVLNIDCPKVDFFNENKELMQDLEVLQKVAGKFLELYQALKSGEIRDIE